MKMPDPSFKGEREEITDLLSDKAFTDKKDGNYVFRQGKVLRFNYEDTITTIKITRIDRKNKRAWGIHINLVDQKIIAGHYGHDVDYSRYILGNNSPFCRDCNVPISEPSTEDGEVKAADRQDNELSDGTRIE